MRKPAITALAGSGVTLATLDGAYGAQSGRPLAARPLMAAFDQCQTSSLQLRMLGIGIRSDAP
jgi:hypothetical protein